VSEQYPREEDDDDALVFDSAYEEDEENDGDEVLTSAQTLDLIVFGSFDSPIDTFVIEERNVVFVWFAHWGAIAEALDKEDVLFRDFNSTFK